MPGATVTRRPALSQQRPERSALLYGDISMNLTQGATIWLVSITEVLSRAGCAVTLVLKSPVQSDNLLAPLLKLPGVTVRRPYEEGLVATPNAGGLGPGQAARLLTELDAEHPHDLVLIRGWNVAARVAAVTAFGGRLWTYLTDIPQSVPLMTTDSAASLARICRASRYLLCQTEGLRCFIEESILEACGKCVLVPPMVPLPEVRRTAGPPCDGPLRLVYTGKFAPRWNTLEMTQMPPLLAARGISAQLHMVGDKIHHDPADPGYQRRMRAALGPLFADAPETPATEVIWHGGLTRQDAMTIAASCDIGLGWLHEDLDASLELSTKILEFGSMHLPVILNRSLAHEDLLGADYPLFASDLTEAADAVERAARDPVVYKAAARAMADATEQFGFEHAVRRVRAYLDLAFPSPLADSWSRAAVAAQTGPASSRPAPGTPAPGTPAPGTPAPGSPPSVMPARPLRVVVAGHDLRFFALVRDNFERTPDIQLRVDQWTGFGEHDPAISKSAADWADVVICEWCGPNAVWYSKHKRRGSRLLVRLHRFEATGPFPAQVRISAVDQVICVNEHFARHCREVFAWPAHKVTAVSVAVDAAQLDRPKLEGADHHLGMIGIVPALKRLDLALDILEDLRREDDSYLLFIKSWLPWEHGWWAWRDSQQRRYYTDVLRRIRRSPLLRDAVVFDEPGPDVPAWLRRVGFILSTSDVEGFHTSVAEGMASGAVPVLRNWPGAETVYDMRWIHADPGKMAAAVAALRGRAWQRAGAAAQEAAQSFSRQSVQADWRTLLTGNLPAAVP